MPSGQKVESASVARTRLRATQARLASCRARSVREAGSACSSGECRIASGRGQDPRSAYSRSAASALRASPLRAARTACGPDVCRLKRPRCRGVRDVSSRGGGVVAAAARRWHAPKRCAPRWPNRRRRCRWGSAPRSIARPKTARRQAPSGLEIDAMHGAHDALAVARQASDSVTSRAPAGGAVLRHPGRVVSSSRSNGSHLNRIGVPVPGLDDSLV